MKKIISLGLAILLVAALATTAFANATAPPGMLVYVPNAPEDLVLTVEEADYWRTQRLDSLWDCYYRAFYSTWDLRGAVMRVETGGSSFEVPIPEEAATGDLNMLTLDIQKQTLTAGEPWWRQPLLVGLRVILTLVLEGLVFWRFGYRKKWSWAVFLAVNLATQTALNITVASDILYATYNWTVNYVLMEAVIFAVEAVAFGLLLKEEGRWHGVRCALAANAVSMAVGGAILSILPV